MDNRTDWGDYDTLVNQAPLLPSANKKMMFAPCEGNSPISIWVDEYAEELTQFTLFCGQAMPPNKIYVPYGQKCRAQIRSADNRFAECTDNLLWKMRKLQTLQISGKASVAVRKVFAAEYTAKHIKDGAVEEMQQVDKGIPVTVTYVILLVLYIYRKYIVVHQWRNCLIVCR